MPSISYAITACNEHVELERLLEQLDTNIRDIDEVVIQLDTTATEEVKEVCYKYPAFSLWEFPLNGDFASFKNHLNKQCSRDYIFQIDADEYLSDQLILNLPEILELNPTVELYFVPRINTVEGLTKEHIQKWRWNINEQGWVNFPDYQSRIYKNTQGIEWEGNVHEKITGAKSYAYLPALDHWCLNHPKTIERQEKQNNYYNTL
jgi:glycosyltransferase involved in cell wall biosynthesis